MTILEGTGGGAMLPLKKKGDGRANILFLTDVFRFMAGSERNIVNLMRRVDRNQFAIRLACFKWGPLAERMADEGHEIHRVSVGKFFSWPSLKHLLAMKKLVAEKKISLIVTYHESSDFFGLLLSKLCRVPVIANRRDMGFTVRWKHEIAYRSLGRYFDLNIVVCRAVQEVMERKKWFPAGKIKCIYNGVDSAFFRTAPEGNGLRRGLGIPDNRLVVGVVANLRGVKGIRYFIEAASLIRRRKEDVHFIVIGEDMHEPGCTEKELLELAGDLSVADRMSFLGARNDVPELMKIIDIGVLPSLSEGFSNVILEFMSCGKPVVAADVGGNREAVTHGETGYLVAPADEVGLSEAIIRLLEREEERKQFGSAGRERVEEYFTLDGMIREYEQTFLSVISQRGLLKKWKLEELGNLNLAD
jgi:glycosyltransferase involved in cell wall biosynthesis